MQVYQNAKLSFVSDFPYFGDSLNTDESKTLYLTGTVASSNSKSVISTKWCFPNEYYSGGKCIPINDAKKITLDGQSSSPVL